ncbi:hypothetical protein WJX74_000470 [Apatococcus lobatus]|uniref:Cyclin-like domain-containing protein n=2 Tax=Apatococcus TaxID=904362 RepID=A0AAW1STR9_9CHLO
MVYCKNCDKDVQPYVESAGGFSCCEECGAVVEETAYSSDVAFTKDAGGDSAVVGHFVSDTGQPRGLGRISGGKVYSSDPGDSHERSVQKGKLEIMSLVDHLHIQHREDTVDSSHRLYRLALLHNFTRGRRVNQVAAACTYIYCRQASPPKPFMLIDFSDALSINMFELGDVYASLLQRLRLDQHPVFVKSVDPSLYLHRFAARLHLGKKMAKVADTALQLVKSMKRDWLQTGRRPAGICGAALYIACQVHGFDKSKRDILNVVHVGEATLGKRLLEFTHTAAGQLTADEFAEHSKQIEGQASKDLQSIEPASNEDGFVEGECCEHVASGTKNFAKGMCQPCYLHYLEMSGGHLHGAHPPAYVRAQRLADEEWQRRADEEAEQEEMPLGLPAPGDEHDPVEDAMDAAMATNELGGFRALMPEGAVEHGLQQQGDGTVNDESAAGATSPLHLGGSVNGYQAAPGQESEPEQEADAEAASDGVEEEDRPPVIDTYSDISDSEVDGMILSEAESRSRKKVWEQMNADWLEKQEAREASRKQLEAGQGGESEAAAEGAPKGKKRGRKLGGRNAGPELRDGGAPPESTSEAVGRMLAQKKLSSKLNHSVLEKLFDEKPQSPDGQRGQKGKQSKVGAAIAERQQRQAAMEAKRQKREKDALAADEARRQKGSMGPPPAKLGSLRDSFKPTLRLGRSR